MKILALDIATKCGWATDTASGVWDLKPNRGESSGMRVVRFKAKVKEIVELESIDLVSYERPAGMHKSSIMVASEMVGVLIVLCEDRGINYASYSATEIKKYFTGKGTANKDAMLAEAKRRFPHIEVIDDNHADALALLELTKSNLS